MFKKKINSNCNYFLYFFIKTIIVLKKTKNKLIFSTDITLFLLRSMVK
jgi:hypothetical protein